MRWLEYTIFLALVVGLVKPVGLYLARVFERKPTFLDRALCPVETMLYRLFRIRARARNVGGGLYTLLYSYLRSWERSCCSPCCCFKHGCRADRTTVTSPRR